MLHLIAYQREREWLVDKQSIFHALITQIMFPICSTVSIQLQPECV